MNASAASALCPICGEGHVTEGMVMTEHAYKGTTTSLPLRFTTCDTCGSESAGLEESRANKRAAMAFRKSVDGLLTGAEICALRERFKLTQTQAANLFGGGPVAFSKYENDDVAQSEAMDNLLRLVRRSDAAFWVLVEEKGMQAEFSKAKEIVSTSTSSKTFALADYRNGSPRGPNKTTLRPYRRDTEKWK
ncbi:type II toxin-antitoxin system MqsA family antitoxin [Rhodoferax sp.]|uniref:type II toxin-antitoxin system MqsA family antitoxin n=1 Tax=Rhodoferax sp. TaxID=50421 RepID=UPI00276977BB|nr:type II toxin-antitoxin system MqsA family antitoxin [Rhodoferax sp.]